jgi:hypothetical protein
MACGGAIVRRFAGFVLSAAAVFLVAAGTGLAQKQMAQSARMKAAKTAYFVDRTGADAAGAETLAQLKKWGRFQMVGDRKNADVVILFTADPYHGGEITTASGETGRMEDGTLKKDPIPNYNSAAPTRDAYLSVVDSKTGDLLWSDSHVWGGVLTGANSAGARMVKKLEKEMK